MQNAERLLADLANDALWVSDHRPPAQARAHYVRGWLMARRNVPPGLERGYPRATAENA